MLRKSLAIELDNFFNHLGACFQKVRFTKSAFVQARKNIDPLVFKQLIKTLISEFYTDNELGVQTWRGFRLLAVDGSRLTLPHTEELKAIYGETKNQTQTVVVQGRVSVLYDTENQLLLDGSLAPLAQGERALALEYLKLCGKGDLIIYDRGYPSYDFIYQHIRSHIEYVMRVKISFSKLISEFPKSGKSSEVISIFPGKNMKLSDKPYERDTPIKLRLVRVELPSGEVEILMTSLIDSAKYPDSIFKSLYQKRWGVETYYDELKNKLKVENFSGYSNHVILQDFYATLFISNVQTLIINEMDEEIKQYSTGKKYDYKVNTNTSYGLLKNRILDLFLSNDHMENIIEKMRKVIIEHMIPIRPNRSYLRESGKYRNRMKPKVTKNQKDAI